MIRVKDWTEFKKYLDRGLSPQELKDDDNDGQIKIIIIDGQLKLYFRAYEGDGYGSSDTSTEWTEYVDNYQASANQPIDHERPPFGSKKLPNNKSLFRRIHGLSLTLDGTLNAQKTTFVVPYTAAKITSTEIVGAKLGDSIDFKVLDTAAGTVTTIPNYPLNQFGFSVYPSENRYEQKSEYDADLFVGLQLEITVTPVNTDVRTVYFNLVLHEVI